MSTVYKCRLCLNTTTKKVNIFKDDYPKMIELLSGLKVDPNDGLLKNSCLDCAKDVKFCMSVRKQILSSHKTLIEEFLKGHRSNSSPTVTSKINKLVKKVEKPAKSVKDDSPLSSDEEENNFDEFSDNTDPEPDGNPKPEATVGKNDSSGTIIEEITIIHETLSPDMKSEPVEKENIKTEPVEGQHMLHSVKVKSQAHTRLSACKLMKKRNMLAASNKILNQQKPLNDRRYCNVIFIRKSRREKLEKQKNKLISPKRDKIESDENVIIKNGKKYAACEICKREVKKHYMKHHLSTHFPKHFTCDVCGATTRNIRGLRYHKLYWHSSKLDYICDKCGKKYRSKHALDLHDKKEHGGVRDLECNICGKKFFQKMHLKRHVDGIHKKLRPHKCEYCGKDFSKRTHLVTHWRTHTNETPYGCDMCGDRFKLKLSLKNHLKRVHNFEEEEKVFCDVCKRGFASEQGLRAHINSRVHEGQKCQYCSEVFTDEYMKNHLRDVHGVGLAPDSIVNMY
ncbi:hypothetical protein GWI33_006230 [Rhynchophorus ferrugineus]|uniref:Uncharacterized protein n=1 Tax=Rhynchophorus ferrugineus TaxID=354439 RepID=A0A834MJ58_RHYFE|nr:hypothetical protein GWI33_006230 [Rhynchophorus ferrugineus]